MADLLPKLPRQVALTLGLFPISPWAQALVSALNQFSLEVVQAMRVAIPQYKTLDFSVGTNPEDSFPIDFPVTALPVDVWVAGVPVGDTTGLDPITVKWQPIATPGLAVRVQFITGLASDSSYSIRLGYR